MFLIYDVISKVEYLEKDLPYKRPSMGEYLNNLFIVWVCQRKRNPNEMYLGISIK